MKTVALERSDLTTCIDKAQHDRVVVLRDRKPAALIVGIEGLGGEQVELGSRELLAADRVATQGGDNVARGIGAATEAAAPRSARVEASDRSSGVTRVPPESLRVGSQPPHAGYDECIDNLLPVSQ